MYEDAWSEEDEEIDHYDDNWLLHENWRLKVENWRLRDRVRELEIESARRGKLAFDMAMTSDRMKFDLIMCGALTVPKKGG